MCNAFLEWGVFGLFSSCQKIFSYYKRIGTMRSVLEHSLSIQFPLPIDFLYEAFEAYWWCAWLWISLRTWHMARDQSREESSQQLVKKSFENIPALSVEVVTHPSSVESGGNCQKYSCYYSKSFIGIANVVCCIIVKCYCYSPDSFESLTIAISREPNLPVQVRSFLDGFRIKCFDAYMTVLQVK